MMSCNQPHNSQPHMCVMFCITDAYCNYKLQLRLQLKFATATAVMHNACDAQ